MEIALPAVPAGILTLLAFFAPYAIGALNGVLPFVKTAWQRKLVSIVVAIVLAAIVVVFYQNITGEPIGNIWVFMLLALGVIAISYAYITRGTAKALERKTDPAVEIDASKSTRAEYRASRSER